MKRTSVTERTLGEERQRALTAFQHGRRLQEVNSNGYGKCCTCGRIIHVSQADGGHRNSRICRATELVQENCQLQCRPCNRILRGNREAFDRYIARRYGPLELQRLDDMAEAEKGSDEALSRLREEDRKLVLLKKDKAYYQEQTKYWKGICRELSYKEK